jgi:ABC-type antimicrobial peptide transport system permease subunit
MLAFMLVALMVVSMFAACGKDASAVATPTPTATPSASATASATPETTPEPTLKGEITFVHHRTDRVDTTFVEYIKKFNEKYPDIIVKQETMTDYEGQIKIRMNTADYGDVLGIPNIDSAQLKDFFIPLGTKAELEPKYNFINTKTFGDTVYGLAMFGNANGIVYNKKVFAAAGITNTMLMAVMERRKECAMLRAMGFSRGAVTSLFVWEGVMTGLLGALSGALAGALATYPLAKYGIDLSGMLPADIDLGYRITLVMRSGYYPQSFIGIPLCAVALSALSCLVPVARATKEDVASLLRRS